MRQYWRVSIFAAGLLLVPFLSFAALKIMPLGDSITEGDYTSNYRLYLERLLREHGVEVDFVGTLHWGADSLQDADMEGHNGYTVDQIRRGIETWMDSAEPEIILLMIGTNDMWGDPLATLQRLDSLLAEIFALSPGIRLFVSSIPPISYSNANERVQAYNAGIPALVAKHAAQGFAISFVDIYSRLTLGDLADGVHPNDIGHQKVARGWYDALSGMLDSLKTRIARTDIKLPQALRASALPPNIFDAAGRSMRRNGRCARRLLIEVEVATLQKVCPLKRTALDVQSSSLPQK